MKNKIYNYLFYISLGLTFISTLFPFATLGGTGIYYFKYLGIITLIMSVASIIIKNKKLNLKFLLIPEGIELITITSYIRDLKSLDEINTLLPDFIMAGPGLYMILISTVVYLFVLSYFIAQKKEDN